uniref:L-Fucosyltransferase n=1 Tax=Globodera rostochiensis TaxID=31243 RepID=A0A914H5H1_GLORO
MRFLFIFVIFINCPPLNDQHATKSILLTDGHNGKKIIPFYAVAQCSALNWNGKSPKTFGLAFRLPRNGAGRCDDGILICYPKTLTRNYFTGIGSASFWSRSFKVKRTFQVVNEKNNTVSQKCEAFLEKNGITNGKHWRGIYVYTKSLNDRKTNPTRQIILETSLTPRVYNFGSNTRQLAIHFGLRGNRYTTVTNEGKPYLTDEFNRNNPYSKHLSKGAFLEEYTGLWLLGMDMLPSMDMNNVTVFIERSCSCTMEAWFTYPTDSIFPMNLSKMCKRNVTPEEYESGVWLPYMELESLLDESQFLQKNKNAQIKYIKANETENETFFVKSFAPGCCTYKDPQKAFSMIKEKYIKVMGNYFQSYKFFEKQRTEIRQIFQFGEEICKTVDTYQREFFDDDHTHKFCVHVRLGDFEKTGIESKNDFTELGIEFGFKYLKKKFDNISVVLLGAEKQFLMDLKIDRQLISNVFLPKAMSRGEDLAFAATACDSLLITASSSTFSWWIAYLMPDQSTFFYNSNFNGTKYSRENFLPDWIPIQLINGTMMLD